MKNASGLKTVLRIGVFVVAGLLATAASAAVVDFQEGYTNAFTTNYVGTHDTTLINSGPDYSYGGMASFGLGAGGGGQVRRALLKFDLTPFAQAYSSVTSITLRLTLDTSGYGTASPGTATVYSVATANAGWMQGTHVGVEAAGESCWNSRNDGVANWAGSAGLSTEGVDYSTAWGTLSWTPMLASSDGTQTYDVALTGTPSQLTALIDLWVTTNNAGLFLRENAEDGAFANRIIMFGSRESVTSNWRPRLTIGYVPDPYAAVTYRDGETNQFTGGIPYAGTEDACILNSGPEFNYGYTGGGNDNLTIGAGSGQIRRGLIRFNLASFAGAFSSITSMTLRLTKNADGVVNPGTDTVYAVASASAGWVEGTHWGTIAAGECCWNYCNYSTNAWASGQGGLSAPGTDYTDALGSFSYVAPLAAGTPIDVALTGTTAQLTALVTSWTRPNSNAGLFIRSDVEESLNRICNFAAHQHATAVWRPQLTIRYLPAPKGTVCVFK